MTYASRMNFDPYHKIRKAYARKYRHRVHLEDYWANAMDDFEIRTRMCFRLSVKMIRICHLFCVLDQVEDQGNYVKRHFEKEKGNPLPAPNWSKVEKEDLNVLMRPVMAYTQRWMDQQVNKLKEVNIPLTYDLMGDLESQSSEEEMDEEQQEISIEEERSRQEGESHKKRKNIAETLKAKKTKGKEVSSEEPKQKRQKLGRTHSSASTSSV